MNIDRDLRELLELFRSKNGDFLVVGGHAVGIHGRPGMTELVANKRATGRTIELADAEFLDSSGI